MQNNTLSRADLDADGEVLNIHYGDVLIKYGSILDATDNAIPHIISGHESANNGYLRDGDIVIADTAEDETVGKAIELLNVSDRKIEAGLHTVPCRPLLPFASMYLGYYMNTPHFHKQLLPLMQGIKVLSISKGNISKTEISSPPTIAEQEKISHILYLLDQRAAAQSRIIEALKKYKRGLLSSLFERCIRFKDNDGSEFPEWEQRKLISCCNGFDNLRQPITANLRRKGKYPYYGANGIQDYVDDYIFDGEYILLAEDGGHFDEFASKPIAQFICGRVWVNNHAHIIQAKQGYNNKYIFYCLEHKDIRKYINGSSRAKLNQEDMWDIPIPVPCLREQERIADFMTAIDCAINDHERRLETLRDLKTGLLQQLFI